MQEQAERVMQALAAVRREGYRDDEIVLLSFVREQDSVIQLLRRRGVRLRRPDEEGTGIAHATVHAFKGLEAKVVLLCDIVPADDRQHQRHLLYTGMTRATELVRIFCDEQRRDTLLQWITGIQEEPDR